jgi:hypothetical protein
LSRVYLGIHFRYDAEAGNDLGKQIGSYILAHLLRPIQKQRSRKAAEALSRRSPHTPASSSTPGVSNPGDTRRAFHVAVGIRATP